MILNTGRLFRRLLRTLDIQTICDVGSMDGADALRFRRICPEATIFALEPNPHNYALMEADTRLADQSISCLPIAASDHSGELPFYIVEADYVPGKDRLRRGMSSLHERSNLGPVTQVVNVPTVRLDELLGPSPAIPIALWVDTEGSAFEVINGSENVLPSTSLIHVEVETDTIIGKQQKLFQDVRVQLEARGFVLLATDRPAESLQFNALFIHADDLGSQRVIIRFWILLLWLRRAVAHPLTRILPSQIRQKLAALGD